MMVRKFTGRCALLTSLAAVLLPGSIWAAEAVPGQVQQVVETASLSWVELQRQQREPGADAAEQVGTSGQMGALDEQIFTEISPLIDSPGAVRLPEDQRPAE